MQHTHTHGGLADTSLAIQAPHCSTSWLPIHAAHKRLGQLQAEVTLRVPHGLCLQDERAAAEDAARETRRAQRWAATRAELQAQHAQARSHQAVRMRISRA